MQEVKNRKKRKKREAITFSLTERLKSSRRFEVLGGIIMSSKGILILAIIWIILSPAWFWAENIAMCIIWLCVGVTELIIALIRRNKEKKRK